jgi:hypothetical protein
LVHSITGAFHNPGWVVGIKRFFRVKQSGASLSSLSPSVATVDEVTTLDDDPHHLASSADTEKRAVVPTSSAQAQGVTTAVAVSRESALDPEDRLPPPIPNSSDSPRAPVAVPSSNYSNNNPKKSLLRITADDADSIRLHIGTVNVNVNVNVTVYWPYYRPSTNTMENGCQTLLRN